MVCGGGVLVLSGITAEERDRVYAVFAGGFQFCWTAEEDSWCCALLRKTAAEP
jgi:ribosomal protein L11 methylase PrmA